MSRSLTSHLVAAALCLTAPVLVPAYAASAGPVEAVDAVPTEVLSIWPGPAPGTGDWKGPETSTPLPLPGPRPLNTITNVTTPTLTVFRPAPGKANGTSMVVVPGGGFQTLAIDHEGYDVARWLAQQGVTAFVLKYRVRTSPGFRIPPDIRTNPAAFDAFANSFEPGRTIALADAVQAMHYLRGNAKSLGVEPRRIGMIGFSAGAITTMSVVLTAPAADRPDFAAPIYGAIVGGGEPPAGGPPLFIAVTQDDAAVPAVQSINIFSRWTAASLPAELHVYERGGHGFGMRTINAPVDGWTSAFSAWMASHGWIAGSLPAQH